MLKIRNNNISINRGESFALKLESWNIDGTPYILPPLPEGSLFSLADYTISQDSHIYKFHTPLKLVASDLYIYCDSDETGTVELLLLENDAFSKVSAIIENGVALVSIPATAVILEIVSTLPISKMTHGVYEITNCRYCSILAVTVRAGAYDDIVCEKYINLSGGNMYDGKTNYIPFGWNKFTTQDILESSDMADAMIKLQGLYERGKVQVARVNDAFVELSVASTNVSSWVPYKFALSIPFLPEDTIKLEPKDYTYDVIVYQGILKDTEVGLPLEKILWKKELVEPHVFKIGDSHNV